MFKQSAEKFSTLVQSMKQMTSEMHHELEATRNELRRGVLEMPQEAAESTAQMRKVIVDQIEALAELNRIVAHHGRGLDVVSSGRAGVQRQEEPVLATVGGRNDATRQRLDPAPARPRRASFAPHRSAAGQPRKHRRWTRRLAFRSIEPHRRTGGGNQGRAPARARPKAAAIRWKSLSLDIGRLMDRNLAAEMWDRYQRGESKAFNKRLYTPAGQKAFDEVARKYRADRGFKQTVDRYITEFERLLDEVAREDRGRKRCAAI